MVQTGHALISDPRMLFTFECIDETAPTSVIRFFLSWDILKVELCGLALIHDHVVRWVNLLIKLNPCILMFLGCYTSSHSYLFISRWVSSYVQVIFNAFKEWWEVSLPQLRCVCWMSSDTSQLFMLPLVWPPASSLRSCMLFPPVLTLSCRILFTVAPLHNYSERNTVHCVEQLKCSTNVWILALLFEASVGK